jgi:hypothetical protein
MRETKRDARESRDLLELRGEAFARERLQNLEVTRAKRVLSHHAAAAADVHRRRDAVVDVAANHGVTSSQGK